MQPTQRLQQFIAEHLPLVTAMQAEINFYDGQQFYLQAPLGLNHNDKYTAFGGSLYNLCITNAIGLGFIKAYEKGLDPNWVVAKAEIEYKAPAKSECLIAKCISPSEELWQQFFKDYNEKGRARIEITSTVYEGNIIACQFTGKFALIGASPL